MDFFSLRCSSPPVIQSSSSRKGLIERHSFVYGQSLNLTTVKRYPNVRNLKFHGFKSQTSESGGDCLLTSSSPPPTRWLPTIGSGSEGPPRSIRGSVRCSIASNPGLAEGIKQDQSKDDNVVFVAGATGKVGSRTVRELIKLGFQVRAGVRSPQKAETLVQSVQQMKLDEGATAVEKLKIVECDLERGGIEQAIGNASVVICCIGASEKEVFDITGPCRIDYRATKSLIDAATVAGVNHFILVTSLGTNKIGFPAAILNLFWGVLIWKRKAEEALIASGLPYTIVRPGGMERPTDSYKETHNLVLANEDTRFGGQVSNLQVAELMAFMAKNRSLSYCKVVEVIAETTAPLTPMGDLLAKIPSQRVDTSVQKELQTASTPDTEPSQSIVSETSSPVIEKEPIKTTAQISSAVSPYISYEDLKPPTSPTPTPSTSPGGGATKAKEADALVTDSNSSPSSTQMSSPELSVTTLEKKSIEVEMQKTQPLSPYIAYDDLKPPTSPSPTAPTVVALKEDSDPAIVATQISASGSTAEVTETKPAVVEEHKTRPLSPYFTYDDLKPPTSPIPTQATGKDRIVTDALPPEVVPPTGGNGAMDKAPTQVKVIENELPEVLVQKISHLSPYHVYEDFKPPTTPSPSAPTVLSSSTTTGDTQVTTIPETDTVQTPTSDNLEEKQQLTEPKSRPLSPFPMYDDLKPPTSPIPSLRK